MKKYITLVFVIMLAFLMWDGWANPAHCDSPFSVTLIFDATYDDNIFRYADDEMSDFENNIDPERYPIETTDDLIFSTAIDVDYRDYFWGGHTTLFSARLTQYQFWQNKRKDYQSLSLTAIQYFSPQTNVRFNYYFLPERYLRHYYDEDLGSLSNATSHVPYVYEKHQVTAEFEQEFFEKMTADVYYKYARDIYDENFEEYDADDHIFGLDLEFDVTRSISLEAGYEFETSEAKGYDEPGETLETSDDRDYAYEEDTFSGGLSFRLPRSLPHRPRLNIDYSYRVRDFVTDKVADEYHYGREDTESILRLELDMRINRNWSYEFAYTFQDRDVDVPLRQQIQEVKNFTRNRIGFEVSYSWN